MRAFLTITLLIATFTAQAASETPGFPRDAESLRVLDSQQLRIVRRAGAQCWHAGQGGFGAKGPVARACVMNGTEGMIASAKDPVLKSFHDALPLHARYNEYRPAYFWQRLVQTP